MRYRLFQYALPAPDELEELNTFLGSHRISMVTHHVVQNTSGALLLFLVEHVEDQAKSPSTRTPRIDYREQLSAGFSRYRETQEPEPRPAGRLVEQFREQVPLGVSQQEQGR